MNLEEEFEITKARHKFRVLVKKMVKYFKTIEMVERPLPRKNPRQRAVNAIIQLVINDFNRFNILYEKAYSELESEV